MSVPKIEFDVDMQKEGRYESEYAKYIDMLDDHQNVKIEYETIQEATKVQKAICMLLNRRKSYNITQMRRKNIIYLIKEEIKN